MEPHWIALALALLAGSLGFKGLMGLILAVMAFILGALVMILGLSFSRQNQFLTDFLVGKTRQSWSWFKGPKISNEKVMKNEMDANDKTLMWESTSLTGSSIIDEPLNLILSYVFRDYIYPWHFKLTPDRAFPIHLRDSINFLIGKNLLLIFKKLKMWKKKF